MPRDGSNVMTKVAGTTAIPQGPLSSSNYNATIDDLIADANAPRPVFAGGTGGANVTQARVNLGLEVGSNVQAHSDFLSEIAALGKFPDRFYFVDDQDILRRGIITQPARTLLDDSTYQAMRTTLGLGEAAEVDVNDATNFNTVTTTQIATRLGVYNEIRRLQQPDYESPQTSITLNTRYTFSHALGVQPKRFSVFFRCITAEGGYVAGDEFESFWFRADGDTRNAKITANTTSLKVVMSEVFAGLDQNSTTAIVLTPANWRIVARAWL